MAKLYSSIIVWQTSIPEPCYIVNCGFNQVKSKPETCHTVVNCGSDQVKSKPEPRHIVTCGSEQVKSKPEPCHIVVN